MLSVLAVFRPSPTAENIPFVWTNTFKQVELVTRRGEKKTYAHPLHFGNFVKFIFTNHVVKCVCKWSKIFICCKKGFGIKMSAQNCSGISEMCCLRTLMLTQKSHFYSVQLFEEEVRPCKAKRRRCLFIWMVLYMTNCLLKLPCINGSADDGAALRHERFLFCFLNIFPLMWWRSHLCPLLCCLIQLFARPLCVSWQRRGQWKFFVPLLPFCFSGFFPAAVVGHALPVDSVWLQFGINAQLCVRVREQRRVCLLDQWYCMSDIFLFNWNRELLCCYMCEV